MILALSWYVAQAVAALIGARAASCPPAYFAEAARPDGTFRCAEVPAPGVCDTRAGCNDDREGAELVGILWCAADSRALIDFDGRGAHCGRGASS